MKKVISTFLFCFIIAFQACNPVRQLIESGNTLEQQGDHEGAADYYFNALLKKKDNKDAHEGLKKSAQVVLNEKFTQFSKLVLANKIEESVRQYKSAENYAKNAASVGVILDWPSEYNEVYSDVRDEFVLGLYDDALRMFKDKKFDAAEQQFQKIAEYDSTFKDATILRLNTVLEPLYQRGLRQISKNQFKEADISFGRILEIDDHYKDASDQQRIAKDGATVTLGVFPVLNKISAEGDEGPLNDALAVKFAKKNRNPYVRISVNGEFHKILESRGWQKTEDPMKAAEAGRTLGYRYVLIMQVVENFDTTIPYSKIEREAYEAVSESILNPITNTYNYISKFRKVKYDDTYEARSVKLKLAYQLVNSSDGRVLLSDELTDTKSDEVHLYSFNGNINNIYPDLPTGNYLPPINEAWRDNFTRVKRTMLSRQQLSREICIGFAETISATVVAKLK